MTTDDRRGEMTFELVKTLTELPGPTGHEDAVQDWLATRWGTFSPEVRRTPVGNVLARVGGEGERLLLAAHADEICLMIKSITDEGFLHLALYAADPTGHPPRWFNPINQPALVLGGHAPVEGFFATASGHVVGGRHATQDKVHWNDWFVEIGARSRAEVEELGIHPGCRAIWNPPTRRVGRRLITGKAMDDRVVLAVATLAAERLAGRDDLRYEVWLASTVQEENGLIGAASIVDSLPVDLCLTFDVGLTGDIPGPDERDFPSKLGGGPIIVYQDNSCHYSRRLSNDLVRLARGAGIPVQQAIFANYGSDGASLIRRGVEAALVTCPTRYTHSPVETVDEADVEACVDLLVAFVTAPKDASDRSS